MTLQEFDNAYHQAYTFKADRYRIGELLLIRDVACLDGDGDRIRALDIRIKKAEERNMAVPKRFIRKVEMHHVNSEPSDMTRYDFFVNRNGDYFWFYDKDSGFNFPTYLRYSEVKDIDPANDYELLVSIADWHNCNALTVAECIRVIHIINGSQPAVVKQSDV